MNIERKVVPQSRGCNCKSRIPFDLSSIKRFRLDDITPALKYLFDEFSRGVSKA